MAKKYKLVESKDNNIITADELNKLTEGDFVFLIFENDDIEERLWVKITEVKGGMFTGIIANEPAYIKELKVNDIVNFTKSHIANYSTKEEQQKIIDEFKKTGKLPTTKTEVSFKEITEIVNRILTLEEEFKDGDGGLYKIKRIDRIFFRKNVEELEKEHLSSKQRNTLVSGLLTDDMLKIFLSIVLVLMVPQIAQNIEDQHTSYSQEAKIYYSKLSDLLDDILNIYDRLPEERLALLVQIRSFYENEEIDELPESKLPRLFRAFIEEAREEVSLLQ